MNETQLKLEQYLNDLEEQLRWMRVEYGSNIYKTRDSSGKFLAAEVLSALVIGYSALFQLKNRG